MIKFSIEQTMPYLRMEYFAYHVEKTLIFAPKAKGARGAAARKNFSSLKQLLLTESINMHYKGKFLKIVTCSQGPQGTS